LKLGTRASDNRGILKERMGANDTREAMKEGTRTSDAQKLSRREGRLVIPVGFISRKEG